MEYDNDLNMVDDYSDLSMDELAELQYLYEASTSWNPHHQFLQCVVPVCNQILIQNFPCLLLVLLFRAICMLIHGSPVQTKSMIPQYFLHILSAIFGVAAGYYLLEENIWPILTAFLAFYPVFHFLTSFYCERIIPSKGLCILLLYFTGQIFCELNVDAVKWNKVRGISMVMAMKLISLGFDLDSRLLPMLPNFYEYVGYLFCVPTLWFGPWVSFHTYAAVIVRGPESMKVSPVLTVTKGFIKSVFCVLYLSCILPWIIPDDINKWILGYRDAQTFRFSHYYVCLLGECLVAAFGMTNIHSLSDDDKSIHVVHPSAMEIPRSMVEIVTNWNLPMHMWLKQYVFRPAFKFGVFFAVMSTYIVSSLLHGLNFQLAATLLSLGVYSYVEHVLRRRLASIYSACIESRRCRHPCNHRNKMGLKVTLFNLFFGALSVFHLAYLGLAFDFSSEQDSGYSMNHLLTKWGNLYYASPVVVLLSYIFYLIIRN